MPLRRCGWHPRLRLAGRVLDDDNEAQDIVQLAWLRLRSTDQDIANLPAWLTTVTTRLCLDRLRAKVPVPVPVPVPEAELEVDEAVSDPADEVALADAVGVALQVVLDMLSPAERVAFVLHDTFGSSSPPSPPSSTPPRPQHASWARVPARRSRSPFPRTRWPTGKWSMRSSLRPEVAT
jgi:hypothetical protein